MKPWFGLHLPNYTFPDTPPTQIFDRIVEQVHAAADCGFSLVTVMDHLYQIGGVGPEEAPMLEAYSTLAALARETSRVRLGTLVTSVTYRNPALLVKEVTTLDVISGGRAIFGVGAGWNESEHIGYGYRFPPVKERMDRLEELLAVARGMFNEARTTFEGSFTRVDEALNSPPPVQPGGPPVMVGGGGEQRTLRIAARYADMTHWFATGGLEPLVRKTQILAGYCAELGRNPAEIERTIGTPVVVAADEAAAARYLDRLPPERRSSLFVGTPAQCADALAPYLEAGFTGFTFGNTMLRTPADIRVAGELLELIGG